MMWNRKSEGAKPLKRRRGNEDVSVELEEMNAKEASQYSDLRAGGSSGTATGDFTADGVPRIGTTPVYVDRSALALGSPTPMHRRSPREQELLFQFQEDVNELNVAVSKIHVSGQALGEERMKRVGSRSEMKVPDTKGKGKMKAKK